MGKQPQKTDPKPVVIAPQGPKMISVKSVVTGGAGNFGFTLGRALAKSGTSVILYDIRKPIWEVPPGVMFVQVGIDGALLLHPQGRISRGGEQEGRTAACKVPCQGPCTITGLPFLESGHWVRQPNPSSSCLGFLVSLQMLKEDNLKSMMVFVLGSILHQTPYGPMTPSFPYLSCRQT